MAFNTVASPLSALLAEKNHIIIDGAMGTELEARGCQLNDKLWSAKVLLENPELIYQVHLDYLRVGADFIITSSYQASVPGFARRGLNEEQAIGLIKKSVELAQQARFDFLKEIDEPKTILVGGSVGPYGTLLADGSEYRGDYQLSNEEYAAFHRPRITALIQAGVDFLCFETIPSVSEVKALLLLLSDFPSVSAYMSFSLKDAKHLCDGTPLASFFDVINNHTQIVAVGVNCIALDKVTDVLTTLKDLTNRPLLVYPNSGEQYDPITKTWISRANNRTLIDHIDEWVHIGAKMIGGCCRTGPQDIAKIVEKTKQNR